MQRHDLRVLLLAGLLAVVFERQVLALHGYILCGHFGPLATVTIIQVLPGAMFARPKWGTPTSPEMLTAVAISGLAWAVAIYLVWRALDRRGQGPRPPRLLWRPWLTWHMVLAIIVVGAWSVKLRAADLRAFEHCQRVIEQIPAGATRADVRDAILESTPTWSELEDGRLFDPEQKRIDVGCREVYGVRSVTMHVHVTGDLVERVDRSCSTRMGCDMIVGNECSPGDI